MMSAIAARLAELGIVLPNPVAPIANYVPFVRSGTMLVVSGQISLGPAGLMAGKLGGGVSIEDGQKAARQCALNVIAQIQSAVGNLDNVIRIVRLGGFINCTPDFVDAPKVMNGASDLMVEVFGDKGRHARSTIGVAALPANAAVEVEALVEIA
ncbi:RidA family protein [Phreatobacter sp.]|uniref:RidA family protein n=1 Tax=Phreatobacter sp. TaxID=1966341 RepID=UPI0025D3B894|nr:RidA family protein [Phreatobacter sp.]